MKILIADDDAVSRRILETTLRQWGYEVTAVTDGYEALACLTAEDAPQLAILDWIMPGLSGPEVCRQVRQRAGEPYTYILMLTARTESSDVVQGLEAGADDYVRKPCNRHELEVRLHTGVRILNLQRQLVAAREALREQATKDELTGLWNRRSILSILDRELARAAREGASLALSMGDLDHFKRINDNFGHGAGDQVLQEAARRMRASVRPYDAVGRYGGEEFLIILPGCPAEQARSQADRLRASIGDSLMEVDRRLIPITMSLGVTWTCGPAPADADTLLRLADTALYFAKDRGRNRVETTYDRGGGSADFAPAPAPVESLG